MNSGKHAPSAVAERGVAARKRAGFPWPLSSGARKTRDLEREFQPHTLAIQHTPPSPFTRTVLWSLAALFTVALTWAYLGQIPITTSASAKFAPAARTKIVQTLNTGTVTRILVKDGDFVHRGQPLVALDPQVDHAALTAQTHSLALNALQIQRLRAELSSAPKQAGVKNKTPAMTALETRLRRADLARLQAEIAADRDQIKEARSNLAAGRATLAEYARRAAITARQVREAAPLVPEGAMSGYTFDQLRYQAAQDSGQLAAQRKQTAQLRQAVKTAEAQLVKDKTTFADTQYQSLETAQGKAYQFRNQYVSAQQQYRHDWLRAPVDGTVQNLDVASLGAVVQPGQTLATVVPAHAPLQVEADLSSQDAGFVQVGQRVSIKVTAYPFEQYGTIPGTVAWVSPTAEAQTSVAALPAGEAHQPDAPPTANNSAASAAPPALYYRVHIQPARDWLLVDGRRRTLHDGMTATVDIHTGRRRVLNFFLDPIVKYLDNGLSVR